VSSSPGPDWTQWWLSHVEGSANLMKMTNIDAAGRGQREETEHEEAIPGPK